MENFMSDWAKTNKKSIIILIVIVMLVVLHRNHYNLVLLTSGLQETLRVDTWNRDQYRIIFSNRNNTYEFATLRKNAFGLWSVNSRAGLRNADTSSLTYEWAYSVPNSTGELVSFAFHNPSISLNNIHYHFISGMGWQLCEGPGNTNEAVIVRVLHYGADNYVFHFTASSQNAFDALGSVYDLVDLASYRAKEHLEIILRR